MITLLEVFRPFCEAARLKSSETATTIGIIGDELSVLVVRELKTRDDVAKCIKHLEAFSSELDENCLSLKPKDWFRIAYHLQLASNMSLGGNERTKQLNWLYDAMHAKGWLTKHFAEKLGL